MTRRIQTDQLPHNLCKAWDSSALSAPRLTPLLEVVENYSFLPVKRQISSELLLKNINLIVNEMSTTF